MVLAVIRVGCRKLFVGNFFNNRCSLFNVIATLFSSAIFSSLGTLVSLAMIIPSIAIGWRRMHDTGRAGWWSIIPIVGFVFALQQSDPDMNEYGPPAPPVF